MQCPSPTGGHSPAGGPGRATDRPKITGFPAARGADRMPHPGERSWNSWSVWRGC